MIDKFRLLSSLNTVGLPYVMPAERVEGAKAHELGLAEPRAEASGATLTFVDVFRQHAPYVLGLLVRLGVSAADVDDVAQEVFVAVHAGLPQFEGRSSVKTWLCGIAMNKASQYRRRAYRRRERLQSSEPPPEQPSQEHGLLQAELIDVLNQALWQLNEKQRAVFVMHELEEIPMTEVAIALGCPRFTAYTRLHAARHNLRRKLAKAALGKGSL